MKKTLFLTLTTALFLFAGCAEREIAIEGIVCPEGYTNAQGPKTFNQCVPYDFAAAKAASEPKASTDCVSKECLQKEKDNEDAKSVIQK